MRMALHESITFGRAVGIRRMRRIEAKSITSDRVILRSRLSLVRTIGLVRIQIRSELGPLMYIRTSVILLLSHLPFSRNVLYFSHTARYSCLSSIVNNKSIPLRRHSYILRPARCALPGFRVVAPDRVIPEFRCYNIIENK